MKAIIFGATGMVGQGLLRECLLDPGVEVVLTIGRTPRGQKHEKLRELAHANLLDFSAIEGELPGYDTCFFCLGVTSAGTAEPEYERITYSIPVAAAKTLVKLNPGMTFVCVSGAGADSSEKGRTMWARVKGKAEDALLAMPFKAVYVFRSAFIQPLHGIRSRTKVSNTPPCGHRASRPGIESAGARLRNDHRGVGPGDDGSRETRRVQACAGKLRHQPDPLLTR
jgi:uncharacterized protein YbjT (DUF2867 family)